MRIPPLATNLIGSFPLEYSTENFLRAIDDQVELGIDYISYPQLADMSLMFLEPLIDDNTLRQDDGQFYLSENFDPRLTRDVKMWARDAKEQLRRKSGKIQMKTCVTGPFTLAASLQIEGAKARPFPGAYIDLVVEHPWVLEKLTRYVFKIALYYSSMSSIVSVDEPYLSVLIGKTKNLFELGLKTSEANDLVLETLDGALRGINGKSSIHVCGRIGRQLSEILLETSADILSHEFSEMTQNFESYDSLDPERHSKMLSIGIVSTSPTSDPDGAEPQHLVEKRIKSAVDRYGPDNVMLSPDCGFKPLADVLGEEEGYQLSLRKMRTMAEAKRNIGIEMGIITDEKNPED